MYILFYVGMAANLIVVVKVNQLFPAISFGFMTWLQGSIIPTIDCAACITLIIRWSLGLNTDRPVRGKHAREADNVIQHAQMELNKMGPITVKEWVKMTNSHWLSIYDL
jgi:DASS family divalent anion:Na+ symporter